MSDDDEFELLQHEDGSPSKKADERPRQVTHNQHYDEAEPVSDDESSVGASQSHQESLESPPPAKQAAKPTIARGGSAEAKTDLGHQSEEETSDEEDDAKDEGAAPSGAAKPSSTRLYNPADYSHLVVPKDIQDLFNYIGMYKPQDIELETPLKPFMPDYLPAVGEIDAFLKIPPPDPKFNDGLGLKILDEPPPNQSDPGVLEQWLRSVTKHAIAAPLKVHTIANADKNPAKITQWIRSMEDVHRKQAPPVVNPRGPQPDINQLLQAWPGEFEAELKKTPLPTADINLDVAQYARVVCALLDIPVHDGRGGLVEALHLLFSLYSEFKGNAHFQAMGSGMNYEADAGMGQMPL